MDAVAKYQCPRCHYTTDDKGHFTRHLKKKVPCMTLYEDVSISSVISLLNPEKQFKCPHCTKSFAHLQNMIRHKKNHVGTSEVTLTSTNDTFNHTVNDNSVHNHIDNSTTNNVTIDCKLNITVNLLPFGNEDSSHIRNDTALLNKYISEGIAQAIPEIVNAIYLNDDLPQNKKLGRDHNPAEMLVYKKNVQTGEPGWERKTRADVLKKLVDKGANVLIEHNNNLFNSASKTYAVRDMHDWRSNKLLDIKHQKRGTASVKDAVLLKFREKKELAKV